MNETKKAISNIVFTKNRPLQLEAYLESLHRYLPAELIQTYVIYKVELFAGEYERLFEKFEDCVVVKETDFHSDFMQVLAGVETEYILFGIDDVVFFDSIDFEVIDRTFTEQGDNIFGFTLRFSRESLKDGGDPITECTIAGEPVYGVDWRNGQTPLTRYPFELCCTFYKAESVKKIINSSMSSSALARSLFAPDSRLIKVLEKAGRKRSVLKRFGFFFNPNTLESWSCRWCQDNSRKLPNYLYFQKLCASALQVNMVNVTPRKLFDDSVDHTIEALAQKYKQGYRLDIDFVSKNRPRGIHGGLEHFRLRRI